MCKYKKYRLKWQRENKEKCRAYTKKYCNKNKEKIKDRRLKRDFGISLDEYNSILEKQQYKCAICGTEKSETGKSFAVDHNHKNGKVRGLLCGNCNRGLGNLQDSEEILFKALNYLRYGNLQKHHQPIKDFTIKETA